MDAVARFRRATLLHAGIRRFPRTDWTLRPGEMWAVLGPPGSGQSLLLAALTGAVPLAAGELELTVPEDAVALLSFDDPARVLQRESGFVQGRWWSDPSCNTLTVDAFLSAEQVFELNPFQVDPPRPHPDFEADRRRLLRDFGLARLAGRSLGTLSAGELRKALLVRALLRRPRLLALDNPFASLDRHARADLRRRLGRLAHSGMTVVLAVSRASDIPPAVTCVLRIDSGRAVTGGPPPPATPVSFPIREQTPFPPPRSEPIVEMRDVTVTAGPAVLLDRVTWRVRKGERWAITGPNGSGKSTLLSLVLGDHPQVYAADVSVFGVRRGSGVTRAEFRRRIGWVAPELAAFLAPGHALRDAVATGFEDTLALQDRVPARHRRIVAAILRRLGLTKQAGIPFGQLSPGVQRLALLARALVKAPDLLVLDEPGAGMDDDVRHVMREAVDAAARAGATVLLVTHDPADLPACITHRLGLDRGRMVRKGRVRRLPD